MGVLIPTASEISSSVLLRLFLGVLPSPLQIPFLSAHSPFPSAHGTYLASWMRTMMVHRPISPHTLAVPISAKTSTHSSTLSQVSSFCWGSDCKTQRGGGEQDAGSAWELNGAEAQPSLAGLSETSTEWPWKSPPQKQKVVPSLRPESTRKPTSPPPSRDRLRHHSITHSCYPKNSENITAVPWIAFYPCWGLTQQDSLLGCGTVPELQGKTLSSSFSWSWATQQTSSPVKVDEGVYLE